MQVALSKLLAQVSPDMFSKQVICASCAKQVVGASSSEIALRASSLRKSI